MRVKSISPRVAEVVLCITKRYKLKIVQVYICTNNIIQKDINNFYNHVDETLGKHGSDGKLQYSNREKNTPYGNGNGQEATPCTMDNMKKIQNHEHHIPEESREEMDLEKPKTV